MFGIGTTEFLVILLVGVLVLGPEHLPKIMRTVTRVMSDFRRVSTDFQRTINLEVNQEEWQREQAAKKTKKKKKSVPAPDLAAEDAVPPDVPAQVLSSGDTAEPSDQTAAQTAQPIIPDAVNEQQSAEPIKTTADVHAPTPKPGEPPLQGGSA